MCGGRVIIVWCPKLRFWFLMVKPFFWGWYPQSCLLSGVHTHSPIFPCVCQSLSYVVWSICYGPLLYTLWIWHRTPKTFGATDCLTGCNHVYVFLYSDQPLNKNIYSKLSHTDGHIPLKSYSVLISWLVNIPSLSVKSLLQQVITRIMNGWWFN